MYHIDIKKYKERKYISFFDTNIIKCIKHLNTRNIQFVHLFSRTHTHKYTREKSITQCP